MTSRKPIIYGPDGHPIVRVRDRLAPKPRAGAGLEGWVSWGLVDRSGRVVQGGEQHNLILDTFLDQIAVSSVAPLDGFATHFAVGTGSTAPSVTDTALGSELARASTLVSTNQTQVGAGIYELTLEREFDFGQANGNLTEFGFAGGASSNMLVRELFRDSGGTPITITKTSDYKLRINYSLTVALSPVVATPSSFAISGIGVINGQFGFVTGGSARDGDLQVFARLAAGWVGAGLADVQPYPSSDTAWAYTGGQRLSGSVASSALASAYASGDYARSIATAFYGTALQNGQWTSITVGVPHSANASRHAGALFVIDEGDRFTKDSLHTLTLNDALTVTWGRA